MPGRLPRDALFIEQGPWTVLVVSLSATVLAGLGVFAIRLAGGTGVLNPAVLLVPVLVAAFYLGPVAGIVSALLVGVLVGPAVPLRPGVAQDVGDWVPRIVFYAFSGGLVGAMSAALAGETRRLRRSTEEKELLLRELRHRVKNNLQVVSSLVSLQANGLPDDRDRAPWRELMTRVRSISLVHDLLHQSGSSQVNMARYIEQVAGHLVQAYERPRLKVNLDLDLAPLLLDVERATSCGLIVNELVSNALLHAFADRANGRVWVRFAEERPGTYALDVGDDGVGLPPGVDLTNPDRAGLRLVQSLGERMGATVAVRRGSGTQFHLSFGP